MSNITIPLFFESVKAGFPSPADNYSEKVLDLHSFMVNRPEATFFLRVGGFSMKNAGIFPGDIIVVDRSIEVKDNFIIVAALNGDLTVKRLKILKNKKVKLVPENPEYKEINISESDEFVIWGVVTGVVRKII